MTVQNVFQQQNEDFTNPHCYCLWIYVARKNEYTYIYKNVSLFRILILPYKVLRRALQPSTKLNYRFHIQVQLFSVFPAVLSISVNKNLGYTQVETQQKKCIKLQLFNIKDYKPAKHNILKKVHNNNKRFESVPCEGEVGSMVLKYHKLIDYLQITWLLYAIRCTFHEIV